MSATATKTPEVKTVEIKADEISAATLAGADKVGQDLTLHSDTGTAVFGSTYTSIAGKATEDEYKRVEEDRTQVINIVGLAHGRAAIEAFKKNPDLASSELVIKDPAGGTIKTVVHRSKFTGAPGAEKTEKFGVLSVSVELRSERKTSELSKVRANLSASATKLFASK